MYISDIMMADIAGEAIIFQCDYVNRAAGDDGKEPVITEAMRKHTPEFQDIHISRIVCWGCETGIKASGIPSMNCVHDIDISDCSIIHNKEAEEIDEATAKLTRIRVKRSKVRNFEYIQVK